MLTQTLLIQTSYSRWLGLFSTDNKTCGTAKILVSHAWIIPKHADFNLVSIDYKARLKTVILSVNGR